MEFHRGKEFIPQETELQDIIEKEANEASSTTAPRIGILAIITSPDFLRPFKCVAVLSILLHLSGVFMIIYYSTSFFEGCLCFYNKFEWTYINILT